MSDCIYEYFKKSFITDTRKHKCNLTFDPLLVSCSIILVCRPPGRRYPNSWLRRYPPSSSQSINLNNTVCRIQLFPLFLGSLT